MMKEAAIKKPQDKPGGYVDPVRNHISPSKVEVSGMDKLDKTLGSISLSKAKKRREISIDDQFIYNQINKLRERNKLKPLSMKEHHELDQAFQDFDPVKDDYKGRTDYLCQAYQKDEFIRDPEAIVHDFETKFKREYQ